MKKKFLQLTCVMALTIVLLTGCGEDSIDGGIAGAGSASQNNTSVSNEDGASAEATEEGTAENNFADFWFGKLEPTGEQANPYPFTRLGKIDGYLPGMTLKDIQVESFTKYYADPGAYQTKIETINYEEISSGSFAEVSYYCMAPNWEGVEKEECIVEYVFEGGNGMEQDFMDGDYFVVYDDINGMNGKYLGLDSGLSGAELMDTIVETWGMPTKVMLAWGGEAYLDSHTAYLIYDCGEFDVEFSVFCNGGDNAKLTSIFVLGEKQKDRTAKSWEAVGSSVKEWHP